MGSDEVPVHQDSTSIDELWTVSPPKCSRSPSAGSVKFAKDEVRTLKAEAEIPNEFFPEHGEGCREFEEDDAESRKSIHLGSYFLSSGSIRIPEAADFTSIESAFNEERAAHLRRDGDEKPSTIYGRVRMHTNELFDRCHKVHNHVNTTKSVTPLSVSLVPLHLKFEDIRFKIVAKKGTSKTLRTASSLGMRHRQKQPGDAEKHILNGVTGAVRPGEILAMMGPSGSGKTTMLNILGGRTVERFTGTVSYNGLPYSSSLKRRIGYVTQDDILFPILTVRETLVFAALLRLSKSMSHKEKIDRAETVLRELGLERCQNTIVGGAFVRGVSGGERKRTSIGYEILVDPSLLLLDEPTSGLDSSTAFRILQVLKANSQVGRVIVTTIHQPSSRMFPMFDKLILLSEGHPIFFGAARDAMEYFASLHFIPKLVMNPADFLLDLASGITSDMTVPPELTSHTAMKNSMKSPTEEELEDRAQASKHELEMQPESPKMAGPESSLLLQSKQQLDCEKLAAEELAITMQSISEPATDDYQRQLTVQFLRMKYRSELQPHNMETLFTADGPTSKQVASTRTKKHWSSSWWEQFIILCRRNCRERRKDYTNILRLAQGIAVAILLGMLWWRPKLETEQEIRDQVGLLFYICIFWCTFSMWSTLMIFPLERNYLAKERAADMYRLSAYFMSSTLCDMVAELIHPTLFVALVYFMTGLKSDFVTFSLTLLSVYLIAVTSQAFGEFFGAATLSIKSVGIVSAMIMLLFLLAGGYYVQNIPVFLHWIRYLSIVYYGFNMLQRVQYSPDQAYNCHEIGGCLRYDESPIFGNLNLDGGMHDAYALIGMAVTYKFFAYLCLRRV